MNSSSIALWAAAAATTSWTVKAVAIGTAGGLGLSPIEGPLFLAGLACFVVATLALGVAGARDRSAGLRTAAAGVAVRPLEPARHWVWSEVNLWVLAVTALGLAAAMHRRAARRATPAASPAPAGRARPTDALA
jgi:hypothetical protein